MPYFLGPNSKMHVNMKVIDDKLKIIDDVPNSAVEMAVKEKVSDILIHRFIENNNFNFLVLEKSSKAR